MKNVFLLQTDKPSRLQLQINGKLHLENGQSIALKSFQNLYITSDEKIEVGDWFYNPKLPNHIFEANPHNTKHLSDIDYIKKIVLTTDPNLVEDGIQEVSDELIEWLIDNPCEYVKISTHQVSNDEIFYTVMIPENSCDNCNNDVCCCIAKEETLESAAKEYVDERAFKDGAKWQAKRMYSEEDMFEFSQWISHNDWVYLPSKKYWVNEEQEELEQKLSSKEILNLWFEQFKKK